MEFDVMQYQCCSENIKPTLILQEYIPIRIEWERKREIVRYLEYTDEDKALLEIVIGAETKKIHRITVPMCQDYAFTAPQKGVNSNGLKNMEVEIRTNDDRTVIQSDLKIFVYDKQVDIVLSKEFEENYQTIENGRVRFMLDESNFLKGISIKDLSEEEEKHIKQELEFQ